MKICTLGSHPATRDKAPFQIPEWEIWACSTHNAPPHANLPRFDRFYEVHPTSEHPTRPENYQQWLDGLEGTGKLWMMDRRRRPWAHPYPKEKVIERFGPYFLDTSSIAYIMAHAILTMEERGDKNNVLGIFGCMQEGPSEFLYQRPGIQFFATIAWELGIDVAVPEESGILVPWKNDF
jgi:hypothetical protein